MPHPAIRLVLYSNGFRWLTVAVVKGMLSMKDDAIAETHTMRMIATSIWCCGGTPWEGVGRGRG